MAEKQSQVVANQEPQIIIKDTKDDEPTVATSSPNSSGVSTNLEPQVIINEEGVVFTKEDPTNATAPNSSRLNQTEREMLPPSKTYLQEFLERLETNSS